MCGGGNPSPAPTPAAAPLPANTGPTPTTGQAEGAAGTAQSRAIAGDVNQSTLGQSTVDTSSSAKKTLLGA